MTALLPHARKFAGPGTAPVLLRRGVPLLELASRGGDLETVVPSRVHPDTPGPVEEIPLERLRTAFEALLLFPPTSRNAGRIRSSGTPPTGLHGKAFTPRSPRQGPAGRRRDEAGPGRRWPSCMGVVRIRDDGESSSWSPPGRDAGRYPTPAGPG